MMESILVKVSFNPDETVLEKSSQMLTKLDDVKCLHDIVGLIKSFDVSGDIGAISVSTEPCGHECSGQHN